jgi:hypothetical protein
MDRQRGRRRAAERPGAQQGVQVGAVVGVAVAEQHRVDTLGRHPLQQPRHGGVPRVDHHPEPVVLDEVAAAGLPGRGPGAAATQHRHPHGRHDSRSA